MAIDPRKYKLKEDIIKDWIMFGILGLAFLGFIALVVFM
jgi:hypothetical protein